MKSGTTALYYYLEQHPQIFMSPVKEPDFFCSGSESTSNPGTTADVRAYERLFADVLDEKAYGEASHCYLYEPGAVGRIKGYIPEARLIAILRNPVDRAYSHFLHMVRNGTEPLDDFSRALREEMDGVHRASFQDYVGRGLYHEQLTRYFNAFDEDQIRIYLHEDLNDAAAFTLRDIFRFLEVDTEFIPDMSLKRNVSGRPKNETLDKLLRRQGPVKDALKLYLPAKLRWRLSRPYDTLKNMNLTKPPAVKPEVRQQLIEVYREDILKLQELMQRDLSQWLK
jgi:hypothetical protein